MKITVELNGGDGQHLIALAAMISSLTGDTGLFRVGTYVDPLASDGYADRTVFEVPDDLAADVPFAPPTATLVPPPPSAVSAVSVPVPPAPTEPAVVVPPPPVSSTVAAASGDRDSAGIPWDARIHSASKALVANGEWRRRKNTPDETFESVMAELRATAPAVSVPVPPAPPAPAATESTAVAATPATDVPAPPKAPAGSVVDSEGFTYAATLQYASNMKHTYDTMNKVVAENFQGITQAKELLKRPEDWPMFRMLLDANAPGDGQ